MIRFGGPLTSQRLLSVVLILCCGAISSAQITLSQDIDSGALDVANSSVNGTTISLQPRNTWTSRPTNYRWVYFRADGANASQPVFQLNAFDFLGSLDGHRFVYSYDQQNWSYFDNGSINGSLYEFGNNTPFTQDQVYVAYGLPFPYSRTRQWVESLDGNPFVSSTSSGNNFVLGQSAGGIDDTGRTIPAHDLYAFQITDPTSVGTKQKVLLAGGAHSSETPGQYALQGLVDFLLGDSLVASQLRSRTEFYVYPEVNPDGKFAGYYRSSPENPDKDFNRFYNDPTGFTDLTIVTNAMQADTQSDVDYLFDFHSWFGPWTSDNFLFTLPELVNTPFLQQLAIYEPDFGVTTSTGQPGMLRIWGMSPDGLNATYAFTPEIGFHPGVSEMRLAEYGENFARALLDTIGTVERCDLNADLLCDVRDVDLLTSLGDLVTGVNTPDAKFDLNTDGMVNQLDLDLWLALAATENGLGSAYLRGDADLNGVADGADFIEWNTHKFQNGTVWSEGDFDGSGFVDAVDFIAWNDNKFQSSTSAPEPSGATILLVLMGSMLAARRRNKTRSQTVLEELTKLC